MQVLEIARGVVPADSSKRPYLDLSIYLKEDGTFSGDVVLPSGPRRLPKSCRIANPERFFAIPEKLMTLKEYLRATEHPSELVVTLRDSSSKLCCSFFMSQVESPSILLASIEELESLIWRVTDPGYVPTSLTPAEEREADVNAEFALHAAVLNNDLTLIDDMIRARPEQLQIENGNGFTPLEQAVWLGSSEAVERLVRSGANVNVRDGYGQTPLHIACNIGDQEKVALLIDHGADVNASKADGYLPIHYAIIANRRDIVRFLKSKGAQFDPNEPISKEAMKIAQDWKDDV